MKIIYLESNNLLLEKRANKPDKQAAKMIAESGLFDEETSSKIIKELMDTDIHAFTGADDWLDKYIKGVARMIIEEAEGDPNKAVNFLEECPAIFDEYLTWIRENRKKLENHKEQLAMDDNFINKMSYKDVKDFINKLQAERDVKSKDELKNMKFDGNSDYELIPIDSYNELHSKFGGKLTGNGTGDSSAWCHTNGEGTYNAWINRNSGGNKFFILAKKGFKDIPFNKESNSQNPKDEYGNSLIALLVDKYGNLQNATLRCNHEGIGPGELADKQYKTYAELSKVAGFNVEKKIQELVDFEENPIKDGVYYYDGKKVPSDLRKLIEKLIEKVIVKEGVTEIGDYAFHNCKSLTNITIPNSVTKIGYSAFCNCTSLTNVTIPDNVTKIGEYAFWYCKSLTNITIPDSVTEIGCSAFEDCTSLTNITIPDSVTNIGEYTFCNCTLLKNITIPDSVTRIEKYTFYNCTSLTNIKISDNVTEIGKGAFEDCTSLTNITIPDSVTNIGEYTFCNCTLLKNITIPDSVTRIEKYTFYNCTSLTNIKISDNVTEIGDDAFYGCSNIIILCHKGSYAEQYCIENEIPYELI